MRALAALGTGSTIVAAAQAAAQAAGRDRTTIHRWLRDDYPFQVDRAGRVVGGSRSFHHAGAHSEAAPLTARSALRGS